MNPFLTLLMTTRYKYSMGRCFRCIPCLDVLTSAPGRQAKTEMKPNGRTCAVSGAQVVGVTGHQTRLSLRLSPAGLEGIIWGRDACPVMRDHPMWLPKWFYELLPYLYVVGALVTASFHTVLGYIGGFLLFFNGCLIWVMRRDYRQGKKGDRSASRN